MKDKDDDWEISLSVGLVNHTNLEKVYYLAAIDNYCSVHEVLLTSGPLAEGSIAQIIMSTNVLRSSTRQ